LNRSHTRLELHFQGWRANEKGTLFNILDDDAFSPNKRRGAPALSFVKTLPEIKPPLREPSMANDLKIRRPRIQELDGAKVSAGKGNGGIHNFAEDRLQTSFADGERGELVQLGQRFELRDQLRLGLPQFLLYV
jgi:hypothetical protein